MSAIAHWGGRRGINLCVERIVLSFPGLYQGRERVKTIAFWRIAPRLHQALDFIESAAIVVLVFD